jgi:hypothetical protein
VDYPQMTERELEIWRRDARARNLLPPERIKWPACVPTSPADLARFVRRPPPPDRPAPKSMEEAFLKQLTLDEWQREDMDRHRAWCALSVQHKSQLNADQAFADASEPYWEVRLVAMDSVPDSGAPPLLIRAATAADAQKRYMHLCGVTGVDERAQKWHVVLWAEPAAAATALAEG